MCRRSRIDQESRFMIHEFTSTATIPAHPLPPSVGQEQPRNSTEQREEASLQLGPGPLKKPRQATTFSWSRPRGHAVGANHLPRVGWAQAATLDRRLGGGRPPFFNATTSSLTIRDCPCCQPAVQERVENRPQEKTRRSATQEKPHVWYRKPLSVEKKGLSCRPPPFPGACA